jgi:hypothetical protein
MDNRAVLLLGHTRWRTRGDERVNSNNHSIRAGEVIGSFKLQIGDFGLRILKMLQISSFSTEQAAIINQKFNGILAARPSSMLRTPHIWTPCWRRKKAGGASDFGFRIVDCGFKKSTAKTHCP